MIFAVGLFLYVVCVVLICQVSRGVLVCIVFISSICGYLFRTLFRSCFSVLELFSGFCVGLLILFVLRSPASAVSELSVASFAGNVNFFF